MPDWESILKDAGERVQRANDELAGSGGGAAKLGLGAGGDRTLLVDKEAEDRTLEALRGVEGGLRVITEEKGEFGPRDARWCAIIDPIDGSSNFERGIPFYCTSIAVLEGGDGGLRDLKHALVRNLVNGDVYYAEAGGGAEKNGSAIRTSGTTELSDAAIIVDSCRASVEAITRMASLISSVKRQSHFGANALEVCFLAEGKVDCFVDVRRRMRITDFAGGYLVAREAGAVVTGVSGEELDPSMTLSERFSLIASANETLHGKVLGKVR